jgi:uncharacterized protein (DUF427 family)
MPDVVDNPFMIAPATVQAGRTRARAFSDGILVADAAEPLLVWEHQWFPQYFFAPEDIEADLVAIGAGPRSKSLGPSELFDVIVGEKVLARAAQRYPEAPVEAMRTALTLTWAAFDTWLEEDEVIHTHPRSPYVRVDALPSSRSVRVVLGGEVIAESSRSTMVVETGLAPRFYLPRADIRMEFLKPSDTTSHCPYKGTASYWSASAGGVDVADAAWGYTTPLPESVRIAGLIAFWPERSTELEVYVDGRRLARD